MHQTRKLLLAPLLLALLLLASPARIAAAQTPAPAVLAGGTRIIDTKAGAGEVAEAGRMVAVHYTGWLYVDGMKGKQFDSSRGGEPFIFMLGAGQVILGWDEGVAGMKVGGTRTLIVPPQAGYGDAGGGDVIPPGATLLFEVELLAVR